MLCEPASGFNEHVDALFSRIHRKITNQTIGEESCIYFQETSLGCMETRKVNWTVKNVAWKLKYKLMEILQCAEFICFMSCHCISGHYLSLNATTYPFTPLHIISLKATRCPLTLLHILLCQCISLNICTYPLASMHILSLHIPARHCIWSINLRDGFAWKS